MTRKVFAPCRHSCLSLCLALAALAGAAPVSQAQCGTSTTLTSSGSPSIVGNQITFTASLFALEFCQGHEVGFCDGSMNFYAGDTLIGSAPMNLNSCMETFQTTALGIGTHQVTAAYESGNPYLASSTSHELTQVVDGYATSTTLTSTLNPSVYGQSVTWTATVTTSGPNPPTGSINFKWTLNGQTFSIGAATLNANGVATLARSNLDADLYPITAVYPGDANNAGSDSPVLNQTIQPATSTAALTSTPNPSTVGQAVIFTATISSPTVRPTGPVTFAAGKSTLGTGQLSKGKATLTTSSLAAGSTMVTATFNGDSNIAASSASVVQAVTSSSGNSTTTTITSSANPASFGEKVAFTAQVSSGAGTPPNGEIVTFSSGSTVLGPGVLSGGLATLMTSLLPGGINSITASYPGDATYLASTSAPLSQQIQTTATSAIVTWVASAPQNEILTATVAGPNGTPTGSVTFTVGNTVLGTSQLANGVATLTVATLAVGSNTITATYNGDQNNAPTSAWTTQTFVMPYNATMYLQQEGGSAAGTTEFGIGTWPTNFVQDYSGLPNDPNPTGQVLVGSFDAGTIVNVGMYTTFGSQVGWAFSDEVGTNQAALISFADLSNELGLNHSITQQTSSSTWLLWLDDAVSYLYDDDNNDVMMEIILVAN